MSTFNKADLNAATLPEAFVEVFQLLRTAETATRVVAEVGGVSTVISAGKNNTQVTMQFSEDRTVLSQKGELQITANIPISIAYNASNGEYTWSVDDYL